ncbi:MAG TPA: nickel pincer cofactor biosynthesis protein LarC, partial [Candidatus Subteraquimicrobiales bacterium]
MRIAYFDCFSGVSGDMILGALLDLGLSLPALEGELGKLPLKKFKLVSRKVTRGRVVATKFEVLTDEASVSRTLPEIIDLIERSGLDTPLKTRGKEIFRRLGRAEAKIHGESPEKVHFHEVGALDSIVDIMGAVIGFDLMKMGRVYASPVAISEPAPATLEILKGVPVYGRALKTEITTPTGAAILRTYAQKFGPVPPLKIEATGYGAGTRKLKTPNVLRVVLGEQEDREDAGFEELSLLETNVDNTNPQIFEHLMERLFQAGALDVWMNPVYMKKNRPAVTVSVLSPLGFETQLVEILLTETDTLGVRVSKRRRQKALQKLVKVDTKFGKVAVKIGEFNQRVVSVAPEYAACLKLAKKHKVPLKIVFEEARARAKNNFGF